MSCLGRTLEARGHRITYFQFPDCEEPIRKTGLPYRAYGVNDFPAGSLAAMYSELGKLDGASALRFTVKWFTREAEVVLREVPGLLREERVQMVLVDQASLPMIAAVERVELPYAVISNALILNRENGIPPFFTPWAYSESPVANVRNRLAYAALDRIAKPLIDCVNRQRRAWNMAEFSFQHNHAYRYPHIAQQPACFDFPRRAMPGNFYYTGPFHDVRVRPPAAFPWERLTGRPLIYASMGTMQNRLNHVFHAIAEACRGLDADLVISLGGGGRPEQLGELPGRPVVVGFAPQLELLAKATLTITHAGLNTALETLTAGVPAVAIPVGNDQPGVAARLKHVGAGEMIPVQQIRADRLRPLVERVLGDPRYRDRARALQAEIRKKDGVGMAADIVERVIAEHGG
jgi:MGT family glycosyltransferase